jgi:hypothetical protein
MYNFLTFSHKKERKKERKKKKKKKDRKTEKQKNFQNFLKVIQQILTAFVYCCLGKTKNLLKVILFNIFATLPFTSFTDFTGKFHYFYHFTSKFKTR